MTFQNAPGDRAASLPEVFRRLSRETEKLAGDCDRLQSCIGLLALRCADPALAQDVQAIDSVVQLLFGLSVFMEQLGEAAPPIGVDLDAALAGLTLSDLAARLSGLPAGRTPAALHGTMELL